MTDFKDEAWDRAERETNALHGKWSPYIPTLTVFFIVGLLTLMGLTVTGLDGAIANRLGFVIVGGSTLIVWLIERSKLRARSETFNSLYHQYRNQPGELQQPTN